MNGANMVDTRGLFVSFSNLGTQIECRTNFTLTASSISQQPSFISLRRSQRIYVQQFIASASVSSFLTVLRNTWQGKDVTSLHQHFYHWSMICISNNSKSLIIMIVIKKTVWSMPRLYYYKLCFWWVHFIFIMQHHRCFYELHYRSATTSWFFLFCVIVFLHHLFHVS